MLRPSSSIRMETRCCKVELGWPGTFESAPNKASETFKPDLVYFCITFLPRSKGSERQDHKHPLQLAPHIWWQRWDTSQVEGIQDRKNVISAETRESTTVGEAQRGRVRPAQESESRERRGTGEGLKRVWGCDQRKRRSRT